MNLMDLFVKIGIKDEASVPIAKIAKGIGSSMKTVAGVGTAATAAMAAAGTALSAFVTQSVKAYANYEQLVGGIETLFKDAASTVQGFAENAFQTAGLSANEYMDTAISFSGALLKSLGDDTAAAADLTQIAITDMADQANKYGKTVQDVSATYTSLARGNFQTLDNLFGGMFKGTKSGLEEMLEYAEDYRASMGETVDYSVDSYADIVSAIHDVSEATGVAGTTAQEAASTIQGSMGMLKASWENLLIGLGRDDADLDKLFSNVTDSAKTAFDNIKPVARRALVGIGKLAGDIAPTIAEELPGLMDELLPDLISGTEGLLGGLADALPDLLLTLLDNLPQLISSTVTIAGKIFNGLKQAIPELLSGIWERIDTALTESDFGEQWQTIKDTVSENVDKIKEKWEELKEKAQPLIDKVVEIKDKFVEWVTSPEFQAGVFDAIVTAIDDVGTAIGNVMAGITFILDNAQAAWDALSGGASPAAQSILSAFSPVTSLFNGLLGKISGLFGGSKGGGGGPGHAIGLDYVPFNGYPAILHRGESVLTAREAEEWRRGRGNGSGVVNNFTFNGVSQSDLDYIVAYVNRGLA